MALPSFNLIRDLSILFVGIDNRQYDGVKRFFQSDTLLWDFLHEYLHLKKYPDSFDALNVHDVLRASNMGYIHIEVKGRRWEEIHPDEQAKLIQYFNINVRKLKPKLLLIVGRKAYSHLFDNKVPSIRGQMHTGFKPFKVERTSRNGFKKKSKVSLIRKTRFKTSQERNRIRKRFRKEMKTLNEFRKKHGSILTSIQGVENVPVGNKCRKRVFDEITDCFVDHCVDPITTRRTKKMKIYTGHYEDVKTLNTLLEAKNEANGWDVGIHVDAVSGGFVAPFIVPELEWDFRLSRVVSINVSGHKYGLTYAGVGWCVWRSPEYLPKSLIFNINYLGSDQASFTLNFSKGAAHAIAQYYVMIRLGKAGFTKIMTNLTKTADHLAEVFKKTGHFEIMSEGNGRGLPLVAFRLKEKKHYDEFDIAAKLRERGWIVPAYTMAPKVEYMKMLRVVVREDFSRSRCELLVKDIHAAVHALELSDESTIQKRREHHEEHSHSAVQKNSNSVKVKHDNEDPENDPKKAHGIC